ncbi:MAG: DUF4124 domain-containing protein [Burkholderiales bacterium]|nr:DUF4124 domain-containing protein [Burkholderiales bacterium]
MVSSTQFIALMALTCALALISHDAAGQIHKCRDAQGKISYQQRPCNGTATHTPSQFDPKPAAPPDDSPAAEPAVNGAPTASSAAEFNAEMATLILTKRGCDEQFPGFSQKVAANYTRWRQQNLQSVVATERHPEFARRLDTQRKQHASASAKSAPSRSPEKCDGVVAFLDQNAGPSDARLATPEGTWTTFHEALRNGNANAALRCLGGPLRDEYRKSFSQWKLPGMRNFANSMRTLRITHMDDEAGSGSIAKTDGSETGVSFQKMGDEWRIVEL